MNKEEYISKWLEDSISEEELKQLKESDEFADYERIVDSLKQFKSDDLNVDEALELLKLRKRRAGNVYRINWVKSSMRLAAAVVILMTSYFVFMYIQVTHVETQPAQSAELFLPDSTSVNLNAGSIISYRKFRWDHDRQVELDGEAYFQVQKGSRFDVITNMGTVTVLGTKFNVRNRSNYFEVTCYEGLVRVVSNGNSIDLKPGDMARALDGDLAFHEKVVQSSPGWINNRSTFESLPFIEVIKEFERQYNVTIFAGDINTQILFTGEFVNNDLNLALQSITLPLNLDYDIVEGQQIYLTGEKN